MMYSSPADVWKIYFSVATRKGPLNLMTKRTRPYALEELILVQ